MPSFKESRRRFLKSSSLLLGATAAPAVLLRPVNAAPALITADGARPKLAEGIQIGDVRTDRAVIWSRCDRPARLWVEYDFDENFADPVQVRGPFALDISDFTARVDLTGLPPGRKVHVRVMFQDLSNDRVMSEAVRGHFCTAPKRARHVRFLWAGDTAGQGWGINPAFGGMKIYETMRLTTPDFFIHCGDTIYADGPIPEQVTAENGQTWNNIVTAEVAKVAETLAEFRGRYKYNLLDDNVRRFNAHVPQIWQWDDHEVVNNWSDSKDLSSDARYTEKNVPLLIARGSRAFLEYAPLRSGGVEESERIYRHIPYGELLDVFVIDMRSYRAANSANVQPVPGADTAFLGRRQLDWLKKSLKASKAVWKVIASDMPIGLVVRDGPSFFENVANGDGPVLGREFEIAELLRDIKRQCIENVVWFTADVHYCAAHHYDPDRAQFTDFEPFWEFVAGPLNAGSFGPSQLDNTFGPKVVFQKYPATANQSPYAGLQFFGQVDIDAHSAKMTVRLVDINGSAVFTQELEPTERGRSRFSYQGT